MTTNTRTNTLTRALVGALVWSGVWAAAAAQQTPPNASPMSYETYCAKPKAEKTAIFRAASAEDKALLWKTQVERWRDANNARLNADQRALVQDMLSILVPSTFTPAGNTPEMKAKQQSIDTRMRGLFSSEDQNALDEDGPCIAKTVK